MIHWMFNCQEVSKKVSQSMDTSLPVHHRILISMHLLMCKYCHRLKKQLVMLKKAIQLEKPSEGDTASSATLSDAARERMNRAIEKALL